MTDPAALPVGPLLDAAVAAALFGWSIDPERGVGHPPVPVPAPVQYPGPGSMLLRPPPAYSTDLSAAWEVVGQVEGPGCRDDILSLAHQSGADQPFDRIRWVASFRRSGAVGIGDTAPEAVCRAALVVAARRLTRP